MDDWSLAPVDMKKIKEEAKEFLLLWYFEIVANQLDKDSIL